MTSMLINTKGHNSLKTEGEGTVHVFSTLSDDV